jgi:hypothetical protein
LRVAKINRTLRYCVTTKFSMGMQLQHRLAIQPQLEKSRDVMSIILYACIISGFNMTQSQVFKRSFVLVWVVVVEHPVNFSNSQYCGCLSSTLGRKVDRSMNQNQPIDNVGRIVYV